MTVDLHEKTDRYRRTAEIYGWGECSYLVSHRSAFRQWMTERRWCLTVLKSLLTLRLFAKSEGAHPKPEDVSISLVVNDRESGCLVYHVTCDRKSLEALVAGGSHSVSSRDIFLCDRAHCADGEPLPIYGSQLESSRVPRHEALMEAVR